MTTGSGASGRVACKVWVSQITRSCRIWSCGKGVGGRRMGTAAGGSRGVTAAVNLAWARCDGVMDGGGSMAKLSGWHRGHSGGDEGS